MAGARGLGWAFLRAKDPESLYRWYERHLKLSWSEGCFTLRDEDQVSGLTVVAFFPADMKYLGAGGQQAMLNFRVDDWTYCSKN
jgi:hypothetical protein